MKTHFQVHGETTIFKVIALQQICQHVVKTSLWRNHLRELKGQVTVTTILYSHEMEKCQYAYGKPIYSAS